MQNSYMIYHFFNCICSGLNKLKITKRSTPTLKYVFCIPLWFFFYIQTNVVSEWLSACCLTPTQQFFKYHGVNKSILNEMMMRSALFLTNTLGWTFYSVISLKQQSADRHVAPIGHIIMIPIQPVFAFSPNAACVSEKQQNNYIVFGLIPSGLEPTIYHPRGQNADHYTTTDVRT